MNKILARISYLKKEKYEIKIIVLYRYLSLLIMSLSYLISSTNYKLSNRILVIMCITISSIILTYLYVKHLNSKKIIALLVFIETLGNSIILIPSGGLNSLYFWYALNTILIASLKLNKKCCWINLIIYLFVSIGIVYYVFERKQILLFQFIYKELNHIISFVIITMAIILVLEILEKVQKERIKLEISNNQLTKANYETKKSMEHIMALYQAVHNLTDKNNNDNLIKLLIHYTKNVSKVNNVFFQILDEEKGSLIIEEEEFISEISKRKINNKLKQFWENKENIDFPADITIDNKEYIVCLVKSTYKLYGILGIGPCNKLINKKELYYQLKFMSDLSSIVLERFQLEKINEVLLINEEQNRIANEIHDSVLQKLFSMSCGLYQLIKKIEDKRIEEIKNDLEFLRNSTNAAMKQLRETIYGFSWKKNGVNILETKIKEHLKEIQKLHDVKVLFNIKGNCESLLPRYKKALYRIICEGTGNSIRHGKSSNIIINLNITKKIINLHIKDNGIGFDINKMKNIEEIGMGIRNIGCLTEHCNGKLEINSKEQKGTTINIKIPNYLQINQEVNAV